MFLLFYFVKNICGKFLKRWEYQTTWPASSETCMQVKKQQLELDMVPNWERSMSRLNIVTLVVTQGQTSRENQGGSWSAEMEKPDPYHPSLPHVVTINGFQVLRNSITCLPSYPIGRRYLPYSPRLPTLYMCLIQSANDMQDLYPTPCILGIIVDFILCSTSVLLWAGPLF